MIDFTTVITKINACTDTVELANLFDETFPEFRYEFLTWEVCRDDVFLPRDPEYQLITLFANRRWELEDQRGHI